MLNSYPCTIGVISNSLLSSFGKLSIVTYKFPSNVSSKLDIAGHLAKVGLLVYPLQDTEKAGGLSLYMHAVLNTLQ